MNATKKYNLIRDLWVRRVPHILGTYAVSSSGVILFLDWFVERYELNNLYTDVLLIAIVTLIPSIIMVSYFHGKPGKDEWMKTELIGIPVNLLITFLCIFIFVSPDLLSGDQEEDNKIFKSIAVLYLENLSNDSEGENWCAGITDGIITSISKLGIFNVKSRTDVLQFRRKVTSHDQIGEILGVDAYITGSLQRVGEKVFANISLIDARNGVNIWAERFEKTTSDIFNIPEIISKEISRALGADILPETFYSPAFKGSDDTEIFLLLGEGINLLDSGEYDRSLVVFDSLLAIDPNNMRAAFSRGQAFEKMGDYANAVKTFEGILPSDDQYSRTEKIWIHPSIDNKSSLDDIKLYPKFLVSEKHNIQIIPSTIKDHGQIMFAVDIKTNKPLWKKSLIDPNPEMVIVDDKLFLFSATIGNQKREATIYGYNIINGKQIFADEIPRKNLSDRVIPSIITPNGNIDSKLKNMIFLYVRRDESYELMLFNTDKLNFVWKYTFPLTSAEEGKPLLYLVEENNQVFILHAKGTNLFLLSIMDGSLKWEKSLEDKSDRYLVYNNKIIFYSKENPLINISNIIDQNLIARYNKINDGVDSIFTLDNNIIIHSNRKILSLQTSSRVFRSLLNWQNIFSDDIVSVNIILKNIFVLTRSGGLFCVDGNNGEIKAESRVNDYSNVSFYHDSTKNSLVVFDGSFLMGLDPNNGKSLWKIREFSHKHFIHSLTDNIQLSGNRLVVLSPPEEKSQLIIKTYNRNTGELLWLSDENLWADYGSGALKKGKTFT